MQHVVDKAHRRQLPEQLKATAARFVDRQLEKLPAEHKTDFAEGGTGEQLFEARALRRAGGSIHALIAVDDFDTREPISLRCVLEGVLQALAFGVVFDPCE